MQSGIRFHFIITSDVFSLPQCTVYPLPSTWVLMKTRTRTFLGKYSQKLNYKQKLVARTRAPGACITWKMCCWMKLKLLHEKAATANWMQPARVHSGKLLACWQHPPGVCVIIFCSSPRILHNFHLRNFRHTQTKRSRIAWIKKVKST